ncbi:MAG TPA: hypothetical protein VJ183_10390 [Chloroflexia bacterium]|nr:hypothetical protein [Chloroflexia bacterium]
MLSFHTDNTCYLLEPKDLAEPVLPDHIERHRAALQEIVDWANAFLCNPHPELGREGKVCPYTTPSLERNLFWLTIFPAKYPTIEEACNSIMKYRQWFYELEPTSGRAAQYKTILMLFPELEQPSGPHIMDMIQASLKPEFVADGLMLGQFYSDCEEPGLWNPHFRPLRTNIPLLAIRHMVPTDFPFLKKKPEWVASYLQRFGENIPSRIRDTVEATALSYGLRLPDTTRELVAVGA